MSGAVVDLDHLARYTGGDVALNAEILRLFDDQANEVVAKLESILEARDAKSWKLAIHTLKGAARGIGAFALGDAAAAAEPIDRPTPRPPPPPCNRCRAKPARCGFSSRRIWPLDAKGLFPLPPPGLNWAGLNFTCLLRGQ